MTNKNETLVVGATGTVGGEVVRALLAAGAPVRALVRSAGRLPAGVREVRGDLRDDAAIARALGGVRSAFFVAPHEPDEEVLAERFAAACEASGTRIVFVGVHLDGSTRFGRGLKRFFFGRMLPHYRPKFRLSERVRRAPGTIVLMPTNFFQNDDLFREQILDGTFSQPFARAVNRVDVRDIGDAAARALLEASLPGGAYPVVGPDSLDGVACAAAWSRALGKPVQFDGERFREVLDGKLAGKKRDDFLATYGLLHNIEIKTEAEDLARTTALLGRAPRSYADYVDDAASSWRAPPTMETSLRAS